MLRWLFSRRDVTPEPEPEPAVQPETETKTENAVDVALRAFEHELNTVRLADYQPLFDLLRARFEALEVQYRGLAFYQQYLQDQLAECEQKRAQLDAEAELISAQYDLLTQKGEDKWQPSNS